MPTASLKSALGSLGDHEPRALAACLSIARAWLCCAGLRHRQGLRADALSGMCATRRLRTFMDEEGLVVINAGTVRFGPVRRAGRASPRGRRWPSPVPRSRPLQQNPIAYLLAFTVYVLDSRDTTPGHRIEIASDERPGGHCHLPPAGPPRRYRRKRRRDNPTRCTHGQNEPAQRSISGRCAAATHTVRSVPRGVAHCEFAVISARGYGVRGQGL
jgi:hypothetical protein